MNSRITTPKPELMKTNLLLVLAMMSVPAALSTVTAQTKPNIIVIFTDDQGYADLGVQGQVADIRTPYLDRLAREGVRCTAGYITAPQCTPSRAGLITGRYQQRFGLDSIPDGPLPLEEVTIAERLHGAGYTSGMVGKWHLNPNPTCRKWAAQHLPNIKPNARGQVAIPPEQMLAYYPHRQGFAEFFVGEMHRFYANFDLAGKDLKRDGEWVNDSRFRVEVQTEAALAFLRRNHEKPFFLYLCYFAPHTPLEAPAKYLNRFSGKMAERRRYALAMLAAVDDGVGCILDLLKDQGIEENTLVVFTSDNGAPLKIHKTDSPVTTDAGGWDGSLNYPWVGEKGMLAEGGIRVPFVWRWKGRLPAGKTYAQPICSLDIAATAVALAGLESDGKLDGVNLLPYLTGERKGAPHEALYWRFWNQAAIRAGKLKYLKAGSAAEFLFDLESDAHETRNLLVEHPEVAAKLRVQLEKWSTNLQPPGVPTQPLNVQEGPWYEHYFHIALPTR